MSRSVCLVFHQQGTEFDNNTDIFLFFCCVVNKEGYEGGSSEMLWYAKKQLQNVKKKVNLSDVYFPVLQTMIAGEVVCTRVYEKEWRVATVWHFLRCPSCMFNFVILTNIG